MSTQDDIIELDSEGNFVVPDSDPTGVGKTRAEIETVESEESFVTRTETSEGASAKGRSKVGKTPKEVLDGIEVGEYKIFKYANQIDVLVHLDKPSSSVKAVTVDAGTLKIQFEKGSASMTVDVSDYIVSSDGAAAAAYAYKDFLSVRLEKA